MASDKQNLEEIKKIIDSSINSANAKLETGLKDYVEFTINSANAKLGTGLKDYVDSANAKLGTGLKDYVDSANAKLETGLKDYVEFTIDSAIEKSEVRMSDKIEARISQSEDKIINILGREISDIAETNREFISKSDNHEKRIKHIETRLEIKRA